MAIEISLAACKDEKQKNLRTFYPKKINRFSQLADVILANTWSPSIYRGNYRLIKNTIKTSLLVLDYDNGEPTLREMLEILERETLRHIVGTSQNHQKEKRGLTCDRFRVVLQPSNLPSTDKDQYHEQIQYFFDKWPTPDKACKDPSRYYFRCHNIVSVKDGDLVKWPKPTPIEEFNKRRERFQKIAIRKRKNGMFPTRVDRFINDGVYQDSRRMEAFYASCELGRCGWSFDKTVSAITSAPFDRSGLTNSDLNDLARQVKNGWEKGCIDVKKRRR